MYGIADISLFESVTNSRCSVFNDAFSEVVEKSDPTSSNKKRIEELAELNPVEGTESKETITNIMDKIEEESNGTRIKAKEIAASIGHAVGSLKKVEAFVKELVAGLDDEETAKIGREFADKYGKQLGLACGYANRAWRSIKKLRSPEKGSEKGKAIIVIQHGVSPAGVVGPGDALSAIHDQISRAMNDTMSPAIML